MSFLEFSLSVLYVGVGSFCLTLAWAVLVTVRDRRAPMERPAMGSAPSRFWQRLVPNWLKRIKR